MDSIEFGDELKDISPQQLISKNNDNEVSRLFLLLGIFYNDLKSFIIYQTEINKLLEDIDNDKPSTKLAEYSGMVSHLERLIISTIFEFFRLLDVNKRIVDTKEFNSFLNELDTNLQNKWNILRQIAERDEEKIPKEEFTKVLNFIRNDLGFHYDNSLDVTSKGFVDHFYNDEKTFSNEKAYYSSGKTMQETRFYYCDAAIQRSIKSKIEGIMEYDEFNNQFLKVVGDLNNVLWNLLQIYLNKKLDKS